jgi:CRP-like cAMP-binding protein
MRYVYRYEGDVIIKKGEVAETYYLIKTGEVACVNEGFYICTLS